MKFEPKQNPHEQPPRPSRPSGNPLTPPKNINEESIGLGDTVSKFIKRVTFGKAKECEPCRKRRERLNKWMPYDKNIK